MLHDNMNATIASSSWSNVPVFVACFLKTGSIFLVINIHWPQASLYSAKHCITLAPWLPLYSVPERLPSNPARTYRRTQVEFSHPVLQGPWRAREPAEYITPPGGRANSCRSGAPGTLTQPPGGPHLWRTSLTYPHPGHSISSLWQLRSTTHFTRVGKWLDFWPRSDHYWRRLRPSLQAPTF